MAYELHIECPGKTVEHWPTFVRESHDFELVDTAIVKNPATEEALSIPLQDAAVVSTGAYFIPKKKGEGLVISVSSPSDEMLGFMKAAANVLGGKVIGDEGEEY